MLYVFLISLIVMGFCYSCDHNNKEIRTGLTTTNEKVSEVNNLIRQYLSPQNADSADNVHRNLRNHKILDRYYAERNYLAIWCHDGKWDPLADSLQLYISTASYKGLFKEDYHFEKLTKLRLQLRDSINRKNNNLWAEGDVLYSDGLMQLLQDLKQGRLQHDSLSWRNDAMRYNIFFKTHFDHILKDHNLSAELLSLEPIHKNYQKLKQGIALFIDSMDMSSYTYIRYPFKKNDKADSLEFIKKLQKRLSESGIGNAGSVNDSISLAEYIKKYQRKKMVAGDGKVTVALIRLLNNTDSEKFKRIAVTLDRFKLMPAKMPQKYIWVNLPAFKLEVFDGDTVTLTSKVICGKPGTPTPQLTSAISDMIIYPTWTVPNSIITKEMLPGLKRNPGYLSRKGLHLVNNKGEFIDATSVSWTKYAKAIPYLIQQSSGENNALGVIKFNFNNPYSVYLHDTNQRYLFKNANRALSHGCVRVQEWEKLAAYIIKNDSLKNNGRDTLRVGPDSVATWVKNKEKHRVSVMYQFPLFIRYFGCESVNGIIKFYDDIYGEDKILEERFFSQKKM